MATVSLIFFNLQEVKPIQTRECQSFSKLTSKSSNTQGLIRAINIDPRKISDFPKTLPNISPFKHQLRSGTVVQIQYSMRQHLVSWWVFMYCDSVFSASDHLFLMKRAYKIGFTNNYITTNQALVECIWG